MRTIDRSSTFKRDYKREAKGRHRATLDDDLKAVLVVLATDQPLNVRYRDHDLSGDWAGYRGRSSVFIRQLYDFKTEIRFYESFLHVCRLNPYSCIKTPSGEVELFAGELTGSTTTGFEGWIADTLGENAVAISLRVPAPPFKCLFCGAPSWFDPADQPPPAAYCHESDHGEAEPDRLDVLLRVGSGFLPAGSADIDSGGVLRLTVESLDHHGRPSAFFAKAA